MHQRVTFDRLTSRRFGQREQQALDDTTAWHPVAEQPRREHAGVVHDQQVAASQVRRQLGQDVGLGRTTRNELLLQHLRGDMVQRAAVVLHQRAVSRLLQAAKRCAGSSTAGNGHAARGLAGHRTPLGRRRLTADSYTASGLL